MLPCAAKGTGSKNKHHSKCPVVLKMVVVSAVQRTCSNLALALLMTHTQKQCGYRVTQKTPIIHRMLCKTAQFWNDESSKRILQKTARKSVKINIKMQRSFFLLYQNHFKILWEREMYISLISSLLL